MDYIFNWCAHWSLCSPFDEYSNFGLAQIAKALGNIQKSSIEIEFKADGTLTQKIGELTKEGSWKLFFEADDYFVFDVTFSDQAMSDRILLYKKGKKISREGITPQPSSILFLKK